MRWNYQGDVLTFASPVVAHATFYVGDDLSIVEGSTYKVGATAKVTKAEPAAATRDAGVEKL